MREMIRARAGARARQLRALEARLREFDMRPRLAAQRRRLETGRAAAVQAFRMDLARRRGRLERATAQLSQLSPLRVLERGYAIVSNDRGIVRDSAGAPAASRIHVRLAKGSLDAVVE